LSVAIVALVTAKSSRGLSYFVWSFGGVVFGAGGAHGTDGRGLFKVPGAGGLGAVMIYSDLGKSRLYPSHKVKIGTPSSSRR
jgi:hypothetical protein